MVNHSNFVLFGSMRTGSNYLLSILNKSPDVLCHGELFNPAFVGAHKYYEDSPGLRRDDIRARDDDLEGFYRRVIASPPNQSHSLLGFKFFPSHREYAYLQSLKDRDTKKIILRRDVLSSYVSLQQAISTNIWQIGDERKSPREVSQKEVYNSPVHINVYDLMKYRSLIADFHSRIVDYLESTNQKYFEIWYAQLQEKKTINDLFGFLGAEIPVTHKGNLVKQGNKPLKARIQNIDEVTDFMRAINWNHFLLKNTY